MSSFIPFILEMSTLRHRELKTALTSNQMVVLTLETPRGISRDKEEQSPRGH